MSAFGLNTSSQLSVLAIGQLYHQSATAPGCTTQLRDVRRGLPLSVKRSSKPVSCTLLDNYFIHPRSSSYQKIPELVAEHRLKSNLCLLQYQFEYLPVIDLSLHDNGIMFTP